VRSLSEAHGTGPTASIPADILDAAADAFTTATSSSYYLAGGVMIVAAVIAFWLLRHVPATDATDSPGSGSK
jgi:hypothetical protein